MVLNVPNLPESTWKCGRLHPVDPYEPFRASSVANTHPLVGHTVIHTVLALAIQFWQNCMDNCMAAGVCEIGAMPYGAEGGDRVYK